jgi:hypothetical protein
LPRAEPGSQPTGTHPNLTRRRSDTERQTRQPVRSGEAELESSVMHAAGLPLVRSVENRDARKQAVGMCEGCHPVMQSADSAVPWCPDISTTRTHRQGITCSKGNPPPSNSSVLNMSDLP